jgi:hypothetical protein
MSLTSKDIKLHRIFNELKILLKTPGISYSVANISDGTFERFDSEVTLTMQASAMQEA